jgi:hypothetical protein
MSWAGLFQGSSKDRAKKPNPRNGGEYDLQFKATTEVSGKKVDFDLALHHITDWDLLRGVWNRMVTDKHWGTICSWLYAVGFDVNNIYYETKKPQTPALIATTLMLGGVIDDSVADGDEIHQRITWSTWNLVEGPKESLRTDDRGNFHDVFSTVKAGITPEERANLKAADNVYTAMSGLNLKEAVPQERALALSKALLGVNRTAKIIKFSPDMWIKQNSSAKSWMKNV